MSEMYLRCCHSCEQFKPLNAFPTVCNDCQNASSPELGECCEAASELSRVKELLKEVYTNYLLLERDANKTIEQLSNAVVDVNQKAQTMVKLVDKHIEIRDEEAARWKQVLQQSYDLRAKEVDALVRQLTVLKAALRFYAKSEHYVTPTESFLLQPATAINGDGGTLARQALKQTEHGQSKS